MSASIIKRRLVDISERLKRVRAELAVTVEQQRFFDEESEEARVRAIVAETPDAAAAARDARRQAEAMGRHRRSLEATLVGLLGEQDVLLERMAHELAP